MKALIGMAVYCTETNKKDDCLQRTLESLSHTATNYDLILSVNSRTERTKSIINDYIRIGTISDVILNDDNIGTAEAINKVWKLREPGQHCIKMDDDVVIHNPYWVELMQECIERDPNIGIIGLKRKDCWEKPSNPDPDYKSELIQLEQKPGERWLIVEKAKHIIGTCQMYNSALLDKMGYLYQPSLYGYDDVLASWRSHVAGFKNVFLPQIEIDHIDEGKTEYQSWKERHSGEQTQNVIKIVNEYIRGERSIYYEP
jgi:GT2 family glycosyltransferase